METRPSKSPTQLCSRKFKISQLNTNLEDLPIMQTHVLTKLLAMTACTQIDYSGDGSKADAWHIANFLKFEKDGATLREFKTTQPRNASVRSPWKPSATARHIPPNA